VIDRLAKSPATLRARFLEDASSAAMSGQRRWGSASRPRVSEMT
jgi:hypothetical protein